MSGSGTPFADDLAGAQTLDAADPLASFRAEFPMPTGNDGAAKLYFVGNSLGLPPKTTATFVQAELDRWARYGVEGHFTGDLAWEPYHELLTGPMASIVGGHDDEVVMMNALTVNLHLLMISFYRPTPERHKILIEEHAFPSDHFAVESQIRQRGYDPATSLVVLSPRDGEETLRRDDILAAIADHGSELALIMLPGVHYYTGQVFPMADIAAAGHAVGAAVGFDLAHAVGNIELQLHEWDVDFAAWCSYKYLNGGPGGVGGAFVHRRHVTDAELPKLLGWWGARKDTRFEMATTYEPIPTVESWQLSNAPILSMAALRASLDVFERAGGMRPLRQKSELQVRYLDHLLATRLPTQVESITPTPMAERGCQVALRVTSDSVDGRSVYDGLEHGGVACDWRYPDVIRVAPVPLYNSFEDIFRFVAVLEELVA